jgi:flagellar transcriptional activator FlhD
MNVTETIGEIKEANLTYLMLAQQLLREDKEAAMFRLGIGEDLAGILQSLTPAQVLKMASSNMLLCRFRCDDRLILGMLNGYSRDRMMATSHAAILMSGEPVAVAA